MSESLSTTDCVLFSLAPLGIITAIIGAIRVAGTPKMRALVGRAKESRGEVEADLMSSTSADVCELWNGEGVVRVLGRPILLELIHLDLDKVNATRTDDQKLSEQSAGLYIFRDAINRGLYQEKGRQQGAGVNWGTLDPNLEELRDRQNPPNLSLNVSIKPIARWISVLCIITVSYRVVLSCSLLLHSTN